MDNMKSLPSNEGRKTWSGEEKLVGKRHSHPGFLIIKNNNNNIKKYIHKNWKWSNVFLFCWFKKCRQSVTFFVVFSVEFSECYSVLGFELPHLCFKTQHLLNDNYCKYGLLYGFSQCMGCLFVLDPQSRPSQLFLLYLELGELILLLNK